MPSFAMPAAPPRFIHRLRRAMPTGGGLRDDDWLGRHRLLTWTMIASLVALTGLAIARDHLDREWFAAVVAIFVCTLGALFLPPRRLPSCAVAFGLTTVCAELVMMFDGLTEAHFSFFVVVGALALYRDWVPFLTTLIVTVVHHALFGALMPGMTYDHPDAMMHPWRWAVVHGAAVLLCASTQLVAWRMTESEERRAGEDLTQARAQFSAAFEEAPIAMAMMSATGVVLRINPAFSEWLSLTAPLPPGCTIDNLPIQPESPPQIFARLNVGDVDVIREEHAFRHENGQLFHVDLHSSALRDDAGRLMVVVSHFLDITEKKAQAAALERKVREDSLTRLLSRSAFEDDLAEMVADEYGPVGIIYIDVDRFKMINDSHGHSAGDQVLRTLGNRLRMLAPSDALIARLGGDEFALALPGPIERAEALGDLIVRSCDEAIEIPGGRLDVTLSIGVSAGSDGESAETALQGADLAMYAAKQSGRDRLKKFDDRMRQATKRRIAAEQLLREALDVDPARSLPVWFQPIVSLENRQMIGAEALIRLRAPGGDMVSPADFVPVAEETGLIVRLGQHVLRTSLQQLQHWDDRIGYVSVNVSPRQLSEPGFVPMLTEELQASGLTDHSRLVLEITETAMLQSSVDLRYRLDAIKALGVRLALDDFGTGYSSLTWLQSVPADIVKLDRSFVAGLATDADKAAIISAVLWLAQALDMSVVAEGVEEEEDAAMLARARCPAAQGYLFNRPMPATALTELLPASGSFAPAPPPLVPTQAGPLRPGLPSITRVP